MSINQIEHILATIIPKIDAFVVEPYPNQIGNKIGLNALGQVCILVKTTNIENILLNEIHTENLSVHYDVTCDVLSSNQYNSENYSVLILKNSSLLYYFINFYEILISRIGANPELLGFKKEIDDLRMLFNRITIPSSKTILGLWGELFIIAISSNPEYFISSWHKFSNDKVDFNDGQEKIEVKSTTKDVRIHTFSLGQLKKIINPNTLIASILTSEIDNGKSINDLLDDICKRVSKRMFEALLSKVFDLLGSELIAARDIKFDITTAHNSLRYFPSMEIPRILEKHISKGISNVHFDSELDERKAIIPSKESSFFKYLFF